MTIQTPIVAAFADDRWAVAIAAAQAWRGQCLAVWARVEAAVTETLLVLAASDAALALPHLVGQRFESLARATAPGGPFHADGAPVAKALEGFAGQHTLRAFLCHATERIALDRRGEWMLVLRLLKLRGGQAERSTMVVTQAEAAPLVAALRRDAQRIEARLGHLRATIGGATR